MEEELLDGNLLGDGAVRVALEADALLRSLQAILLDVAAQDGLIANHPDDFVDDGGGGNG